MYVLWYYYSALLALRAKFSYYLLSTDYSKKNFALQKKCIFYAVEAEVNA